MKRVYASIVGISLILGSCKTTNNLSQVRDTGGGGGKYAACGATAEEMKRSYYVRAIVEQLALMKLYGMAPQLCRHLADNGGDPDRVVAALGGEEAFEKMGTSAANLAKVAAGFADTLKAALAEAGDNSIALARAQDLGRETALIFSYLATEMVDNMEHAKTILTGLNNALDVLANADRAVNADPHVMLMRGAIAAGTALLDSGDVSNPQAIKNAANALSQTQRSLANLKASQETNDIRASVLLVSGFLQTALDYSATLKGVPSTGSFVSAMTSLSNAMGVPVVEIKAAAAAMAANRSHVGLEPSSAIALAKVVQQAEAGLRVTSQVADQWANVRSSEDLRNRSADSYSRIISGAAEKNQAKGILNRQLSHVSRANRVTAP